MTLEEIYHEAIRLSDEDQVRLVHLLLGTQFVSDDEVHQRWNELESGEVAEMSHDEFLAGIRRRS